MFHGQARMAKDNIFLGKLEIELPRAPRAECGVDVRFTYDVNGLLQVEATMQKTQHTHALVITGNPGVLTEDDIAQRFEAGIPPPARRLRALEHPSSNYRDFLYYKNKYSSTINLYYKNLKWSTKW